MGGTSASQGGLNGPRLTTATETSSENILKYAKTAGTSTGSCDFALDSGSLVFPYARINHQSGGFVDCKAELQLSGLPAGYRFSVTSALVKGYLSLEPGSYMERLEVSVSHPTEAGVGHSHEASSVRGGDRLIKIKI